MPSGMIPLLAHDKSKHHQHCSAAQRVKEPNAPVPAVVQGVQKMEQALFEKIECDVHSLLHCKGGATFQSVPLSSWAHPKNRWKTSRLLWFWQSVCSVCIAFITHNCKLLFISSQIKKKAEFVCSFNSFISSIFDMEREKLMETLKKTKYFSIMIDGATDAGTI